MECHIERRLLKTGRTALYLRYTIAGKRYRDALELYLEPGTGSAVSLRNKEVLREAKLRAIQRAKDLETSGGRVEKFEGDRISLLDYLDEMIAAKENVTWRSLRKHLTTFLKNPKLPLLDVTPGWIEKFTEYLLGPCDLQPNSAERYLAHLNTLLRQARKQHLIRSNPFDEVDRIRTEQKKRESLSVTELQQLADTPCSNSEVRRAFLFACATGLRYSDITALIWRDVQGSSIYFRAIKTGRIQNLPLNQLALALLGDRGTDADHVFPIPRNTSVNRMLKRWANASGISKNVTFHVARHTYALNALSYGMSIMTLNRCLGHSRLETTMIYASISPEAIRAENNLFPMIELDETDDEMMRDPD